MKLTVTVEPNLAGPARSLSTLNIPAFHIDELYKVALQIERVAKQLTPVDTGRLRSSIGTAMLLNQKGVVVSTNVDYAVFVHEGTRFMRGRPFMAEGLNQVKGRIEGNIKDRLDREFVKAFKSL